MANSISSPRHPISHVDYEENKNGSGEDVDTVPPPSEDNPHGTIDDCGKSSVSDEEFYDSLTETSTDPDESIVNGLNEDKVDSERVNGLPNDEDTADLLFNSLRFEDLNLKNRMGQIKLEPLMCNNNNMSNAVNCLMDSAIMKTTSSAFTSNPPQKLGGTVDDWFQPMWSFDTNEIYSEETSQQERINDFNNNANQSEKEDTLEQTAIDEDVELQQILKFVQASEDSISIFVERTLNFANVIFGDRAIQHINPRILDRKRTTYVRTFSEGSTNAIRQFILSTRFLNTQRIMLHVGSVELMQFNVDQETIVTKMKGLIVAIKAIVPHVEIHISLQIPWRGRKGGYEKIVNLNREYIKLQSPTFQVYVVHHDAIMADVGACVENGMQLNRQRGTQLFARDAKRALCLDIPQQELGSPLVDFHGRVGRRRTRRPYILY
ncbi:hypothetical protein ACOME3_009849 [Neoechinorhynchus agilis]